MKNFRNWLGKNKIKILYLFLLGIVFSVFIALAILNVQVKKQLPESDIYQVPLTFIPQEYPELLNKEAPYISAQGAIVIDRDSQVVLFEKNPKLRFSPASTTKIMSALVALDYYSPEVILTVTQSEVEGSSLELEKGEQVTFDNLLYAMMLPSANDATLAVAQNYPGGEKGFVAKMNEKAKELNLPNTYFEEPVGLLDERDYTTPLELARLAAIAMQNPQFSKVVATKSKTITNTKGKQYKLENLNILLDLPGVNGVKTGFTEGAGQVLVTSKNNAQNNKELIFVVMQSLDRFGDTQILLNFLEGNVTYLSIHP